VQRDTDGLSGSRVDWSRRSKQVGSKLTELRITGTSNLLGNHKAWSVLTHDLEADFGDFADWPTAMFTDGNKAVLWVVFLEDLIPPEKAADASLGSGGDDLEIVFQPLVHRLSSSNHPTLVAFSTWRPESVIGQSRLNSTWTRFARSFSDALASLAKEYSSLFILDLDRVFSTSGMVDCFDPRNYYSFRCRLSPKGLDLLADSAKKILSRITNPAKKVLVVDCDETLWGGILGELGVAGISLGTDGLGMAYSDFQRSLQRWEAQGVLLTVVSKNDPEHVWQVFDEHPDMQIGRDDIVAWRINWEDKASNIVAISEELSLGMDSFVFLDNSPFERERVRQALPQVLTPELPNDVTTWPALLDSMDELSRFGSSEEDARKAEQYRQRSAFVTGLTETDDDTGFLQSIAMKPKALPLSSELLPRAEQLCQKTNQFNLRTMRHTLSSLSELPDDENCDSFLISLTDRFGNHGTVGLVVAILRDEVAFLDSFILSCRALSRHLEAWALYELTGRLRSKNCDWLLAEFLPTERNSVARSFLSDHGFTPIEWEGLPPSHPVHHLRDMTNSSGHAFCADLHNLEIPNLEVFES